MKFKRSNGAILAAALAALCSFGCNGDDNRVPTPQEVKQANANSIKTIEALKIPEASKKELESHLGGPPFSNPAVDIAKSHGAKVAPGGRQF
jgi:hypothetical protein